ncbi:hypothetical protein P4O66_011377, partial [Electrophorus voltai]
VDLQDEPLENPDLVLWVDGSASRDPETGKLQVRLYVKANLPTEADRRLHDLKPGNWIVIKDLGPAQ